jgi:ADP-heptose:LPS heptosyltransferase
MKILCICPIGIGNYVLCYPAFHRLKNSMPNASLHLLALREGIAQIAENDPLWNDITVFDPTKIRRNVFAALKILNNLRIRHFDASLNFFPSNTWQYYTLPWLSGVRRRYAFHYWIAPFLKFSFLSTKKVPVDQRLHDVQQNCELVNFFLGKNLGNQIPVFPTLFSDNDLRWAVQHFESLSANTVRIGIHPGSSDDNGMDAKRWRPENFAGLADNVCRLLKGEAYIFGSNNETTLKERVVAVMRSPAHIIDPVSLSKTAALLSRCTFCLCNDSGLMHISACVGSPTVGIFGPTDEKRNGPVGERTFVIRKKNEGFPIWTAKNVGDRSIKNGINPHESLETLSVSDAWEQLKPWIIRTFGSCCVSSE